MLSLAAGTSPEFQPSAVAEAAGQAGFSHVGFTIEPDKWDAVAMRETKTAISAHGLKVLDVEVIWIPEGGRLDDRHKMIIDAGLEFGAPHALVVSSEPDKNRTADALHQLCEWGASGNMRIALEFLMITAVRNMQDALEIITLADHPSAALLIDTIHFQRAGHKPDDVRKIDPHLLPYAQICDGNLDCADNFESYLEDAIDLRSVPGEGELPVRELLNALPANTPLSLEIRSKAWRDKYPEPVVRAKAIRKAMLDYCDANQIAIAQ